MSFATMPTLLQALRAGKPIVLVDDAQRENEGDLILPAERATPELVNLMVKDARGLICVSLTADRAKALQLEPMCVASSDPRRTAFTVSVDHISCTTGISAFERSATIRALAKGAVAKDFMRPGHVFPLVAKAGGVLERPGHTEASVELARLAGYAPSAVICEIMADDGHMARLPALTVYAQERGLALGCIADVQQYVKQHVKHHVEQHLEQHAKQGVQEGLKEGLKERANAPVPTLTRVAEARLPTAYGLFKVIGFREEDSGQEHLALVMGDVAGPAPVLTRLHSECLTGDVLHALRCDCGAQLDVALRQIAAHGCGVLLYLRQEGRGIGLLNKLKAYALQDNGLDTVDANLALGFKADTRCFTVAAAMLRQLGIDTVRLMTNNPEKLEALGILGIHVAERLPLFAGRNPENQAYLDTKARRMGHLLPQCAASTPTKGA